MTEKHKCAFCGRKRVCQTAYYGTKVDNWLCIKCDNRYSHLRKDIEEAVEEYTKEIEKRKKERERVMWLTQMEIDLIE